MRIVFISAASLFAASAALAAPSTPAASGHAGSLTPPASVEVENQRAGDIVVYAQKDNREVRLGTVAPGQTSVLDLPEWLVLRRTDMRFFVEPVRKPEFDLGTRSVLVMPHERVGVIVPDLKY
jgi:hypothetical protein